MKKWFLLALVLIVAILALATTGQVLASESAGELAKILEAGAKGFAIYLDWLLEVLKVVW